METSKIKDCLLNLIFPKFCLSCRSEGDYLCPDCRAILEISRFHNPPPKFGGKQNTNINDLYWAAEYKNPLLKKLIKLFKYKPFIKDLAKTLASLIIDHFQLIEKPPPFWDGGQDYVLMAIPLEKKKIKQRGFNQSEEIARELSGFLNIPRLNNVLIKTKSTPPQVELAEEARKENIKGVFSIRNGESVKDKKILLVDDVYTTGSTMEEAARVLRAAGVKEIIGTVVARAIPGQDKFQNV